MKIFYALSATDLASDFHFFHHRLTEVSKKPLALKRHFNFIAK